MKKKLCFVLTILLVVVLSACGSPKENSGNNGGNGGKGSKEPTVTIEGNEIELSYESHHKDLYYRENISDLHSDTMGQVSMLSYTQGGETYFQVMMVYFENKTVEEAIDLSQYDVSSKTVNGIEYKYFKYTQKYSDISLPAECYACAYNGTAYTISFISAHDISSFVSVFMENVHF